MMERSCEYCEGTGDVHRADGEWLGECPYHAPRAGHYAPLATTERYDIVDFLRQGGQRINGVFYGWDSEMAGYATSFSDMIEAGEHQSAPIPDAAASEAGRWSDHIDRFEEWWATYRHRNSDHVGYELKKQIAFDAFEAALERCAALVDGHVDDDDSEERFIDGWNSACHMIAKRLRAALTTQGGAEG